MSDIEIYQNLDDNEEVSKYHSKLVEAVAKLDKGRRIKQAERNEPTTQISEYHLVKSGINKDVVHIQDLAKSFGRKGYQTEILKKLRKNKVLSKPLEKPAAERIKRAVGYENVKDDLAKWKGLITKNRTAPRLIFPLRHPTEVKDSPTTEFLKRFRTKSDLMQELEKIDPSSKNLPAAEEEKDDKYKLTKQEMILKRKEIAKFRAQQSYREARARRERKIKSKNYHRIQRKHRIKQQLKEFEELQKSNPQEALDKLEQIEKVRAQERMSLRHRSTGQWAKNKQIRAKYNKEARQVLAEQLAINRDLTQKIKAPNDEDEEEDEDEIISNNNEKNSEIKTESEVDAFIKSYRKYWDEKHQQEKEKKVTKVDCGSNLPVKEDNTINANAVNQIKEGKEKSNIKDNKCYIISNDKISSIISEKKKQAKEPCDNAVTMSESHVKELQYMQHNITDEKQCNKKSKMSNAQNINEMFDSLEERLKRKIDQKLQKVQKELETNSKTKKCKENCEEEEDEDVTELEFRDRDSKRRPILDQPLEEIIFKESAQGNNNLISLKTVTNTGQKPIEETKSQEVVKEINPDKYLNVKPKYIKTQLPDMVTGEDENSEQENETHRIMSEAFADDDVVEEFRKEKEEESHKLQEPDQNQLLPGWGSWVGPSWNENVKKKKRKKNRRKSKMIIMNIAKEAPRKQENKGKVIIFEHENEKLKKHLVNELPYPFNSVGDYEASIRAPISRTFVSENAHSRMIQPAVTTKLGQIIEPIDEDALIKMQPTQMPNQMPKRKSQKRRFDKKNAAKNNKKRRK